ncbi:hypothetical protein BB559_000314 [Furculomyces boomerangus]|uniref:Mitochondrial carrier protein n=2 Tax=Harpellales TaxID=61421 RepID=A0A2T9Z5K5_9FUNG|nr:hypothetical protein BB559_000314 [Furculomyces boomerangus]PWA03387.1 hypothetical protein BB558_000433 [Smittium angustum]
MTTKLPIHPKVPPPSLKQNSSLLYFTAGGLGAFMGAVATAPFDVVRTRLQSSVYTKEVSTPKKYFAFNSATLSTLRKIAFNEGISGLYSGIGANLFGIIPSRAIQFATYGKTKQFLTELNSGIESTGVHLGSAITAGFVTSTLTNPIWVVKTRVQLDHSNTHKSYWKCLKHIIKNESFFGLYKGISASYLGLTEISIQWVVYEHLKKNQKKSSSQKPSLLEYMSLAGLAKLIASFASYPHEVLRTRMRQKPTETTINNSKVFTVKYKSLSQSALLIFKEEGIPGLYGGLSAHLLRVVPNTAIMFMAFEFFLEKFSQIQN